MGRDVWPWVSSWSELQIVSFGISFSGVIGLIPYSGLDLPRELYRAEGNVLFIEHKEQFNGLMIMKVI